MCLEHCPQAYALHILVQHVVGRLSNGFYGLMIFDGIRKDSPLSARLAQNHLDMQGISNKIIIYPAMHLFFMHTSEPLAVF